MSRSAFLVPVPRRARQLHVAAFGTTSAPKRTAFPRHGTAVDPNAKSNAKVEGKPAEEAKAANTEPTKPAAAGTAIDGKEAAAGATIAGAAGAAGAAAGAATVAAATAAAAAATTAAPSIAPNTAANATTTSSNEKPTTPSQPSLSGTSGIPLPVIELDPPENVTGAIDAILGGPPRQDADSNSDGNNNNNNNNGEPATLDGSTVILAGAPTIPDLEIPPNGTGKTTRHLTASPYVHHFDSYSLVKQLEAGGYTQAQAITAMKAVRGLLADNLEVAQSGLVSKSDVENEAYLFKAACAELSIEVRNNRRRADEQTRQQRSLLQHEVDIAAQSVNQELATLNDTVKGLFNDRKQTVREEQKTMSSSIQQLNYKISRKLNSEMRAEIEKLRWVLVRRAVLGIIFMVVVTLSSFRYANYREAKKAAEKAALEAEAKRRELSRLDMTTAADAADILSAN